MTSYTSFLKDKSTNGGSTGEAKEVAQPDSEVHDSQTASSSVEQAKPTKEKPAQPENERRRILRVRKSFDPQKFRLFKRQTEAQNLSRIFKLLLCFEVFLTYACVSQTYLAVSGYEKEVKKIGNWDFLKRTKFVMLYIPPWLAIIFCYLGENFFGMKPLFSIVLGLYVLASNIIALSSLTMFQDTFLRDSPIYLGAAVYSFEITRKVILFVQLKHPDQKLRIRRYIFWIFFLTQTGNTLAYVTSYTSLSSYSTLIMHLVLLVHIFYALFVTCFFNEVNYDPFEFRIVDKYIASVFVTTKSKRSKRSYNKNKRREAKPLDFNPRIAKNAMQASELWLVLFPLIAQGTLRALLKNKLYLYKDILSSKTPWNIEYPITEEIFTLLAYPFGEFVLFPIVKKCRVRRPLQCLALAYVLLAIAYVTYCLFIILMERYSCPLTLPDEVELRFYNVLEDATTFETSLFQYVISIPSREGYAIEFFCSRIRCPVTFIMKNKRWSQKQEFLIAATKGPRSYIIYEEGLHDLPEPDPEPCKSQDLYEARCYVISAIDELAGEIILSSGNIKQKFVYPSFRNTSVFSITPGTYNVSFERDNEIFDLIYYYKFHQSTFYTIVIFETINETLALFIDTIVSDTVIDVYFMFPTAMTMAIAETFHRVTMNSFILMECPVGIRGTMLAFFYMATVNGLGLGFWHWDSKPFNFDNLHSVVGGFLISFFLFIYLSVRYKYKSAYLQER